MMLWGGGGRQKRSDSEQLGGIEEAVLLWGMTKGLSEEKW